MKPAIFKRSGAKTNHSFQKMCMDKKKTYSTSKNA